MRVVLWIFAIVLGCEASIDRVKNFRIQATTEPAASDEASAQLMKRSQTSAQSLFPEEMTANFEAFGKEFVLKLKRNDDLVSSNLKIEGGDIDDKEKDQNNSFGVAYNGISLEIKNGDKSRESKSNNDNNSINNNLFARFFATLKDDKSISLQGGFEWEKNFFKLTTNNHPSVKYHVSPDEISLLKRADGDVTAMESKKHDSDADDEMVILKESMDPRKKKTFGFSFNGGSNSTVPYRCGHDDVTFNTDPRGVGNDFAQKLTKIHQGHEHDHDHEDFSTKINPLTAQYYLAKRSAGNPGESGCPATRKVLYLGVAADTAYLNKFDGNRQAAIANILTDFNLVSAIYEKTFNVEIGVASIIILKADGKKTNSAVPWDLPCKSVSIGERLNAFSKWRDAQDKNIGLYHLVSGCSESDTVGIAWLNQVCQVKSFKGGSDPSDIVSGTSVSVLIPNQFSVIAHEIGHNFGAIHDCDARECQNCRGRDCKCCTCGPCDCQGKFVMNPESGGLNVREFSSCTQSDVCYKINVIGKCLQEPGRMKTLKKATCGNGILEEGEECDCGSEEECKGNPCCSFGCKLKEGAACSDGNEPCCSKCQFRSASDAFKCFTSKTKCQLDSVCDGKSGQCPEVRKAADGATCELDGGTCASGLCTSRDLQCRAVGKRLGITRACKQTPNTCQLMCESQGGTCTAMSAYFMDGTPCGTSGTCLKGKCSQMTVSGFMEDNSALVLVLGATVGALLFVLLLRALITITRTNIPSQMNFRSVFSSVIRCNYSNVAKLNRAERGLYADRSLSFGNTISDFGNRNRRTWKPNIQRASLYSSLLQERVKLRVSTEALRRIDTCGGLDSYILGQRLPESECARKLKERLLNKKLELEAGTV